MASRRNEERKQAMKAAQLHDGATTLQIDDVPLPEPGPGEVRVALTRAFVAPYQRSLIDGTAGFDTPPRPFAPGMDGVGRINKVGFGVAGLEPGQRVYCDNYYGSHGTGAPADHCFLGNFMIGDDSTANLARWPAGSFAEFAVLPAECLIPVPDEVDVDDGLLTRLGWLGTAYGAFRKVGLCAGQDVAVLGATGFVGASAVLVALAMGACSVVALGRRRAVLDEIAALDQRVSTATTMPEGRMVDVVLTSIDGSDCTPVANAMMHLRRHGALVTVADTSEPLPVPMGWLFSNDITVRGSLWFERRDIADLLAMIGSGVLDLSAVRQRIFPLERVGDALDAAAARPSGLEQVVLACAAP